MAEVGGGIDATPGAWSFGGGVADAFDTHVARSVPFYRETHRAYHDWKRAQGYTDSEITAKALSLEGVLEPFTSAMNVDMLTNAGFATVIPVFRWLNWEGLVAFAR